jgi:hypothetical protein
VLLKRVGKPWGERGSDELLDLLDHFYPNMRRALAKELGRRYAAGEKGILPKVVSLLGSDEDRMRDGACKTLSACGADAVLENLSKVVPLLKDDAEFVRMSVVNTIARATMPGDKQREVLLLKAAAEDYAGMTMDNGNVRNAVKGIFFKHHRDSSAYKGAAKLGTEPFQAGYDEELVRAAFERIVTMDPQGTVPGGWGKEALLKLAGPVTFSAEELQMNDAMFGGARKREAQSLLKKHGYREAVEGDAFNLMNRTRLERSMRRTVGFKDSNISPTFVKQAPGLYREYLDDLRLWQQDNPVLVLIEKTGKGMPPITTPLNLLIEIIERDTDSKEQPSIGPDVARMFKQELAAAGSAEEQIKLCRVELENLYRKNFFRKIEAMTYLVEKLGAGALVDVSPFLGHEQRRLREHANKVAVTLVKQGSGARLVALFEEAQARKSGLLGNWNAAGIIAALADAQHKPALAAAKAAQRHKDPVVRKAAVQAVFKIGGDAELKTVFAFIRQATDAKDFHGSELALLSKRDDPAHVAKASRAMITLLPTAAPPLRRSLAWVLGQFGGIENLAAIEKAAATTQDDADLKEMAWALAYSPDRTADKNILALMKIDKRIMNIVATVTVHRMVGRSGIDYVSDKDKVKFARGVLNHKYDRLLITFLGRVYTGESVRLLFDVMKKERAVGKYLNSTEIAAKSIIACAEGIRNPTKSDSAIASDVMTDVIEFIEVTHLRGGSKAHVKEKNDAAVYAGWKGLQSRAAQALLKFHKPEETAIPEFDDLDLDI